MTRAMPLLHEEPTSVLIRLAADCLDRACRFPDDRDAEANAAQAEAYQTAAVVVAHYLSPSVALEAVVVAVNRAVAREAASYAR